MIVLKIKVAAGTELKGREKALILENGRCFK